MRKALSVAAILFFCSLLLVFSPTVKSAAADALQMWASELIPILFPFFVCADMLRLFQGGASSYPMMFLMSMIAGAPAGARLCADLSFDAKTRTDMAASLNMISPMFIFGAYCAGMLKNAFLALPILLAQYISALLMLALSKRSSLHMSPAIQSSAGKGVFLQLSSSIYNAVCAMLSIGGTIVFFRVILCVLGVLFPFTDMLPPLISSVCAGVFEFVNGCRLLSACESPAPVVAALSAFILSSGGLCVMAQSMSFCELLPGRYILRKLVQGSVAAVFAYLLCFLLYKDRQSVFLLTDTALIKRNLISALGMFFAASLSLSLLWIIQFALQKKKAAHKRAAK